MGYDLHITMAESHSDNKDKIITAEEWLAIVNADPELHLAGYNGPYFTIWDGSPECWLDWFDGNSYSKFPDDALIDKMVRIAKILGAKVQGDDGEIYTGGGHLNYLPPPD